MNDRPPGRHRQRERHATVRRRRERSTAIRACESRPGRCGRAHPSPRHGALPSEVSSRPAARRRPDARAGGVPLGGRQSQPGTSSGSAPHARRARASASRPGCLPWTSPGYGRRTRVAGEHPQARAQCERRPARQPPRPRHAHARGTCRGVRARCRPVTGGPSRCGGEMTVSAPRPGRPGVGGRVREESGQPQSD